MQYKNINEYIDCLEVQGAQSDNLIHWPSIIFALITIPILIILGYFM